MKLFARGLFALLWALFAATATAHPYNVSTTQLDWNEKAGHFEGSLRLLPEQLDQILPQGDPKTKDPAKLEGLLADYLRENIQLRTKAAEVATLRWVGMELELEAAWLYFELVPPAGSQPRDLELQNAVLFENSPQQLNTTRVRIGRHQKSWVLHPGRPSVALAAIGG